ncbi:MAG: C_GCAxxG_C_C family protein [Clostridiaceae bacterium]|jgi:C_GCAxxG_C_C family probable redox protein|nr:C_GCAxxG_C_C family protein [Clostridiaceae bacterium]
METVQNYKEKAIGLFLEGYNCCQAVFAACCGRFGLGEADGLRLTAGMGGGMGGLREKCGAVTAMFLLAGLRDGNYAPEDADAKNAMYTLVRELDSAFTERCGSTCCRELLEEAECSFSNVPNMRDDAYYASRPCATLVGIAAEIAMNCLLTPPADEKEA